MPKESSRTTWIVIALVAALVVLAGLIAYFFGGRLSTFVTYQGASPQGSASVVVIACVDQDVDGDCDGDTGRLENVGLELTQQSGAVLDGRTGGNGLHRFDQVEFGDHSLFVTLPFAGSVTSTNPLKVSVSAPTSPTSFDGGSEINVFVPISLTGETSVQAEIAFINPHTRGAYNQNRLTATQGQEQLSKSGVVSVYPGQKVSTEITLTATQFELQSPLTIIDDYDDACTAGTDLVRPTTGKDTGKNVTWTIDTKGATSFTRILSYDMRIDTVLPEISPLLCTNRVTVIDAQGQTVGTTTATLQVISVPDDQAVLEMGATIKDDNGGAIKPGDTLNYTIGLTNIGRSDEPNATLRWDLPIPLVNPAIVLAPPEAKTQIATTGGSFDNGFIEISNLSVPVTARVGEQTTLVLSAQVKRGAKTFDVINTYLTLEGSTKDYVEAIHNSKVGQVPILIQAL